MVPNGEWSRVEDPERYVAERLARHHAADGRPFAICLENGGWVRVRERRTPDGGIVSTWTDISELKATEQHLLDTIDSIGEGFVLLDEDGRVQLCNQRFRDMLGDAATASLTGAAFDELLRQAALAGRFVEAGTDPEGFAARMMQQLGGADDTRLEVPLRNGGWVLASHRRMKDGSVVGIWTDVTIQKKREAELVAIRAQLERHTDALSEFARLVARQARSDALTGLPNRFALEERLDQLLHDGPNGVCVLYIDVDRFKVVNDTVGHAAGDEVLRGIAQNAEAAIARRRPAGADRRRRVRRGARRGRGRRGDARRRAAHHRGARPQLRRRGAQFQPRPQHRAGAGGDEPLLGGAPARRRRHRLLHRQGCRARAHPAL